VKVDITIEIGTDQQKELIYQELSIIETINNSLPSPLQIVKILVPSNFDDAVNILENSNHYKSVRGNIAIGKNIKIENGVALVFSPFLYTEAYDAQIRFQIYSHEFFHVVSESLFPEIPSNSRSDYIYFTNLYTLFDEYYANRKSYSFTEDIFKNMSHKYKLHHAIGLNNFIKSISENCKYYNNIKHEIQKFRSHADIDTFWKNIDFSFDAAAISLCYIYSSFDHNIKLKKLDTLLKKSHFFNNNTKLLFDYIRIKYEENNVDLFDGRELIENSMMNFGLKVEDVGNGKVYCHVLDI
jgi:hypothetical protein